MEPVTHILTGACLARAGFNRRAAYATLTMAIAAEFPDVDTLWGLRGPIEGFQHHRGITHTFLGLPFEAAFPVAAVYGWHRWRVWRAVKRDQEIDIRGRATANTNTEVSPLRGMMKPSHSGRDDGEGVAPETGSLRERDGRVRVGKPLTAAPVRWGVLYGLALLALLSHLLLDYTNNYGLRPFFPFNDRWYAASIVFIFDPVMFAMLLGALVAPWLFGLVSAEVGAKRQPFRARGWAIAALLGVIGWWMLREVEHQHAVQMAMAQSITAPVERSGAPDVPDSGKPGSSADGVAPPEPTPRYLSAQRVLASPDPLSPFRWAAVTDFGPLYQLSEIDTRNGDLEPGDSTYPKPGRSVAVLTAESSKLGRVYMDWSSMPIIEVTKPDSALVGESGGAGVDRVVTLRDPRFMGGWMREAGRTALVGTVGLDAAGRVVRETMDGRVEQGLGSRD